MSASRGGRGRGRGARPGRAAHFTNLIADHHRVGGRVIRQHYHVVCVMCRQVGLVAETQAGAWRNWRRSASKVCKPG